MYKGGLDLTPKRNKGPKEAKLNDNKEDPTCHVRNHPGGKSAGSSIT
jgi:hypothetical protein